MTYLLKQLRLGRRSTISIFGFTVCTRGGTPLEEQLAILDRVHACSKELWRLYEIQMDVQWRAARREAARGGDGGGTQQTARQAQRRISEVVLQPLDLLDVGPAPYGAAASRASWRTVVTRPGVAFCLASCAVACCFLLLRPKEL